MKDISDKFKRSVVDFLSDRRESLHLTEPRTGDDKVVAHAEVEAFAGGLHPRRLVVSEQNGFCVVAARNLAYAGSTGSITNRTIAFYLGHLDEPQRAVENLPEEARAITQSLQRATFASLVHASVNSSRTREDLIAQFAAGSNDVTVTTRAAVDSRDGEVYVSRTLECDWQTLPDPFEKALHGVLVHAQMIVKFEAQLLDNFTPQSTVSPDTLDSLARKFARVFKMRSEDDEPAEDSAESQQEAALTL